MSDIKKDLWDNLINCVDEFAPLAIFNVSEKYFPTNAEKYISDCNEVQQGNELGLSLKTRNAYTLTGDLDNSKAYVNIKMNPSQNYIDIQYWFLYAFNGPGTLYVKYLSPGSVIPPKLPHWESAGDLIVEPCGQHEGDWEHITVRISFGTKELIKVYYSQHNGGQWFDGYAKPELYPNKVAFYASKFGHAAYNNYGRYYDHTTKLAVVEFRLVNDTLGTGLSKDYSNNCEIIGFHYLGEDYWPESVGSKPDWLKYGGRWGQIVSSRPSTSILDSDLVEQLPAIGDVLSDLGVHLKVRDVLKKLGAGFVEDECEKESGPIPPWKKDSWTKEGE